MSKAKMPVPIFPEVTKGPVSPPDRCVWLSFPPGSGGRTSKQACAEAWFSDIPSIPGSCWLVSDVQLEVLLVPQMKLSKLVMSQHESVFYVTPACIPPNPSWAQSAPTANLKFFFLAADNVVPPSAAREAPHAVPEVFWGLPGLWKPGVLQGPRLEESWAGDGSSGWAIPMWTMVGFPVPGAQMSTSRFAQLLFFPSLQWHRFFPCIW